MLWDCHTREGDVYEIIERDDGYIDTLNGRNYFGPYRRWPEHERAAIEFVRGRVLDVGSGAGRHSLYLQDRGHRVTAIDPSRLAVKVCRERGVKDVRHMPLSKLPVSAGPFDTIIMLGNNFGVLDSPTRAIRQLRRLAGMTSEDARILAGTNNVYNPEAPKEHLEYHAFNRKRGRWPGRLRLRMRYRKLSTPWFEYLMVSPDEMKDIVGETPWRIERILGKRSGLYVGVLAKRRVLRSKAR